MAGRARAVAQGVALVAVAAMLGLLVWSVVGGDDGGAAADLERGETPPAPELVLPKLGSDGTLDLASLHGRPVIVNFWASWCEPCKDESPFLQSVYERYRGRGLVVLGVDAQDFDQDARRFAKRYGLAYPIVHDGSGSTLGRWGVTGFPETFFVDRQGRLVGERIQGGVDADRNRETFERSLELALGNG